MICIQSSIFKQIPNLSHAFFAPGDSSSKHDNLSFKNGSREAVLDARRRACELIRVHHEHLTHVYQEHGTTIYTVQSSQRGAGACTGENQIGCGDAMLTSEAGLPLAILIADCLPIFFSTANAEVVGIVHAGWRGTVEGVSIRMIERFYEEFGVLAQALRVWVGPGISKDHFEVGSEVMQPFLQQWPMYSDCFDEKNRRIDLKALNVCQLLQAGVLPQNLEVSSDCTFGDTRFFSYRREGPGMGHNMAVIQKCNFKPLI